MRHKQKPDMPITRIRTEEELATGVSQLLVIDPQLSHIVDALAEIPLRHRAPGFEGMAQIITAQQVSKASASAIFERTLSAIQSFDAETFLAAGETPLIAAGQSRAKQVTLTGLSHAIADDGLDLEALCDISVDDAMAALTRLKGIGPWTAEVFLLFCAGHTNIFPAGDVALQHAIGDVMGLDEKPDAKTTRDLAQRWAPLCGVAARVLYAHYARIKGRSAL